MKKKLEGPEMATSSEGRGMRGGIAHLVPSLPLLGAGGGSLGGRLVVGVVRIGGLWRGSAGELRLAAGVSPGLLRAPPVKPVVQRGSDALSGFSGDCLALLRRRRAVYTRGVVDSEGIREKAAEAGEPRRPLDESRVVGELRPALRENPEAAAAAAPRDGVRGIPAHLEPRRRCQRRAPGGVAEGRVLGSGGLVPETGTEGIGGHVAMEAQGVLLIPPLHLELLLLAQIHGSCRRSD